jgi:hypothetical protein
MVSASYRRGNGLCVEELGRYPPNIHMFPTEGWPFSTDWFTIDGHSAMFAIGDSLHEARMRRGLSAADVQKVIRIRERYLTALEEERWEILPGEAYTKGFLRTYAEFLGLNGNLYIDEYNTRFAHHDEEPLLVPESLAVSHRTRRGVLRSRPLPWRRRNRSARPRNRS